MVLFRIPWRKRNQQLEAWRVSGYQIAKKEKPWKIAPTEHIKVKFMALQHPPSTSAHVWRNENCYLLSLQSATHYVMCECTKCENRHIFMIIAGELTPGEKSLWCRIYGFLWLNLRNLRGKSGEFFLGLLCSKW